MPMFEREDWTLFRQLGTLGQKAGVSPDKIRRLVAKEITDNALDTAGTCDVGMLEGGGFYVQDRGPGIPGEPEDVAALFSIRRPLVSSKLFRLPTRGALGNGLRMVAGAVLASAGRLDVWTRGRHLHLIPQDTGETVVQWEPVDWTEGTRVEVRLGASIPDDPDCLAWAERAILLADGGTSYRGKTSGYWYDGDTFYELLQAAGGQSVRDVVTEFDGCTGQKAGEIAGKYLKRKAASLNRDEAGDLLQQLRKYSKPVKPDRLGKVGDVFLTAFYARTKGAFTLPAARGTLSAEIPFVVEAWARLDKRTRASIDVLVNRTPITGDVTAFHEKSELTLWGCGIDYLQSSVGRQVPMLWLNILTPYMPITTDGKEPNLGPFEAAIAEVVGKAINRAKRNVRGGRKARTEKQIVFESLNAAINKASGGDEYRFSLRQLFYAVRPYILEELNKESGYGYFAQLITLYENLHGDIPGLYRDERGTLYHPHTGEALPLGTLTVEQYWRPEWTFNKILYSEKEGFFEILKSAQWPERHDCALLTSKGFATRAVRDVVDFLGRTNEELLFFCIHDADGYGTRIYQSLQEATRARPERKVRIVNLGLEPWEGQEMGLQVEVISSKKRVPVGDYIPAIWEKWLQTHRIELNAMDTPQFLEWLDLKMKLYGNGKLIPPEEVLTEHLFYRAKKRLEGQIVERVLQEANIDEQVDDGMKKLEPELQAIDGDLDKIVKAGLHKQPQDRWTEPVEQLVGKILKGS